MVEVDFHEQIEDELLKFAVIIAKTNGKWVFCKHKERDTYEIPGGHREENEAILDTAKRELYEETGALEFDIMPICVYSVAENTEITRSERKVASAESTICTCTYGMLYFAEIKSFETELHSEIEKILITDELVENWTYPFIQPKLIEEAKRRNFV